MINYVIKRFGNNLCNLQQNNLKSVLRFRIPKMILYNKLNGSRIKQKFSILPKKVFIYISLLSCPLIY